MPSLSAEVRELHDELDEKDRMLDELTENVETCEQRISELEEEIEKKDKEIDRLEGLLDEKESDNDELEESIREKDSQIEILEQKLVDQRVSDPYAFPYHSFPLTLHFRSKQNAMSFTSAINGGPYTLSGSAGLRWDECTNFTVDVDLSGYEKELKVLDDLCASEEYLNEEGN